MITRIRQVEAKKYGQYIASFDGIEQFHNHQRHLNRLAEAKHRRCAYVVIPFKGSKYPSIQVFLMPEGWTPS